MNPRERYELFQRVKALPPGERIQLMEDLLREIRLSFFTDHEEIARQMDAMVADPGMQRVLNNQDLERLDAAG